MLISAINNTVFSAQIKLKNPDMVKLAEGAALLATGAASSYVALDSMQVIPGHLSENIYDTICSEHFVVSPENGHKILKGNYSSANLSVLLMPISLPLGSLSSLKGIESGFEVYEKNKSVDEDIPD